MGGKRIKTDQRLSFKEVTERMNGSKDSVEFKHWLIIRLAIYPENPRTLEEIADIVGVTYDWVRKIIHRYNKDGEEALPDQRIQKNTGRPTLLTEKEQKELYLELQKEPPDGGLWTGVKVRQWISKKINRNVGKDTGLDYLRRLGFSLVKPRPKHIKSATDEEKEIFKKNWQI